MAAKKPDAAATPAGTGGGSASLAQGFEVQRRIDFPAADADPRRLVQQQSSSDGHPFLTAGVAAPLMALRQSGRCAEIVDEAEEFGEFMKLANVPASYQLDFARVNAGTVKELMTYDGGKLNSERPDMPTVHALLAAAAVGSALVVPNDIPLIDHKKADASADTVRRAEYVALTSNFQVLCQMARVHFPNVIARTVARAVPPAHGGTCSAACGKCAFLRRPASQGLCCACGSPGAGCREDV